MPECLANFYFNDFRYSLYIVYMSMVWGPLCAYSSYTVGQGINTLFNPKVHYCVQQISPLNPILIQMNPGYNDKPYLLRPD